MKTTNPTTTVQAQPENAPTKRERRAAQLLAHYEKCEALARFLGKPNPNGKRISNALRVLEYEANNAATAQCNGTSYNGQPFRSFEKPSAQAPALSEWEYYVANGQLLADTLKWIRKYPEVVKTKTFGAMIDNQISIFEGTFKHDNEAGGQLICERCGLKTDSGSWAGFVYVGPECQTKEDQET